MFLKIAAAQISATSSPATNLEEVQLQVKSAAQDGAQIVLFPEATMARFGTELSSISEPLDGPFATGLRNIAREYNVIVAAGMFTPADGARVHNTILVTGPDVECSYDKIHLYDAFGSRESDTVAPGKGIVTFETGGLTIGLSTCFDLRFAQQFTELGRAGAQLILVPASWGEGPGKAEQWEVLIRARALDAQAWVLACDQAWTTPEGSNPIGIGNSMLVDPMGRVRARLGHEAGTLLAEVDPALSLETRRKIPLSNG